MSKQFLDDYNPKNVDSSTYESTNPDGIKQPFLLAAVGPPGSGKTFNMMAYVEDLVKNHDIHKIYVLSPTYHNNQGHFERLKIPMEVCDDMKDAFGFLTTLKEDQLKLKEIWKEIKKQYPTFEKFQQFVKFIKKNEAIKSVANLRHPNFNGSHPFSLEERAKQYMEQKGVPQKFKLLPYGEFILDRIEKMGGEMEFYTKPPLCLLFCDDIQGTKLMTVARDSPFMNFLIKHRHYYTSVIFCVHSIKNGLPPTIRAQITDWAVFKIHDPKLIRTVYEEAANAEGLPEDFDEFFRDNIDGEKNRFLMINKKEKPIGGRFNWGTKGTKMGMKQMLDAHKSSKMPQKHTFQYTDNRGKKRGIELDMNIPIKRSKPV
jgi:hypothetical protein